MESKLKQHFSKRLNNYFSNYLKDKFKHSFMLACYQRWLLTRPIVDLADCFVSHFQTIHHAE